MPEYLAPGVFVEEVSFRAKSIEGVATSTTGFAGMARSGPVCYPGGPISCAPRLITSFTEFERVYGGLRLLGVGAGGDVDRLPYLAHAVRAFFDNGGQRLYVSRVFAPRDPNIVDPADPGFLASWGLATRVVAVVGAPSATWRARWPGADGNVHVRTEIVRSRNIAFDDGGTLATPLAKNGAVVEVGPLPADLNAPLAPASLRVVQVDDDQDKTFVPEGGGDAPPALGDEVRLLRLRVTVTRADGGNDVYDELEGGPTQKRYIGRILEPDSPEDEDAVVTLEWQPTADPFDVASLVAALAANPDPRLVGGHDGLVAAPVDLRGRASDPDDPARQATGLEALGEIDDIAIVALPDSGTLGGDLSRQAAQELISHAERQRYRIAVVDAPENSSLNGVRDFRGQFDSTYGALYHPWIEILDPTERPAQGAPPRRLLLPPSGFVAGIYARNDVNRGVHKAPANEIVRGLTRFEANITTPRQEVLNPEGINALRFFEGRGYRVWGARTMTSDPEWKYVNVRRLFVFLEHSIDLGTQWAVFEPNGPRLWANIRRTIEDFLLVQWKSGALLGTTPEEAYFVRCDRTTMTQNDLDNGRLICLIGIAPVKPAEFVIFRIGQWTADAPSV